jgi:hypothetical protein
VTSRGACPGISQPMATGDGLLARLMPAAAIPLDALIALCEAGARHGNGIIEAACKSAGFPPNPRPRLRKLRWRCDWATTAARPSWHPP